MKVNRFKDKHIYKCNDKSILHRFLKEEGFNRKFLACDLGIALPTVDDYLNDPTKFKVKHIKAIAEEAEVDINFIFDLIYNGNKEDIQ